MAKPVTFGSSEPKSVSKPAGEDDPFTIFARPDGAFERLAATRGRAPHGWHAGGTDDLVGAADGRPG